MPAERQPAQKNRTLPFKPPRPRASGSGSGSPGEGPSTKATSQAKTTKGKTKQAEAEAEASGSSSTPKPKQRRSSAGTSASTRKKSPPPAAAAAAATPSESGSETGGSGSGSGDDENAIPEDPDYILAEVVHGTDRRDVTTSEPVIPEKLLTRLLHHNFQSEKTKVAKDANGVVAKYVDVFVREALARAVFERTEGQGGRGRGGIGDGFLEVEDLEKMAPQLVLDF